MDTKHKEMWDPSVQAKYSDILSTEWDGVRKHPRCDKEKRAAQFAPFAALVGFDQEIDETARLTLERIELTEEKIAEINEKLSIMIGEGIEGEIVFFVPDSRKDGGEYKSVKGKVSKLQDYERRIIMEGGEEIPLDEVCEIEI